MKNIAIIPARSGSKGIKDKNIRDFNGKPLMAHTIEAAFESGVFEEVYVSTDSEKYAEIAKKYGAHVPFLRSKQEATDSASAWGMISEALLQYEKIGKRFDTFCKLQPTSPLRSCDDIRKAYKKLEQKNANAVISVCEAEHPPIWSNVLNDELSMDSFLGKEANKPRQELATYYRLNGAIYICKIPYFNTYGNLYKKQSYAYIMDAIHSVDIDSELDFVIAETIQKYL